MGRVAFAMAAVCALAFGLTTHGAAQTRSTPSDTSRDNKAESREAWKPQDGVVESKSLIGTRVKGPDGKDLGEIDQLLIDTSSGKITHAVLGLGGLLGVGEKKVVVPWSEVKLSKAANDKMQVTMDQSALDKAPRYERRAAGDRTLPSASPATTPRSDTQTDPKTDKKY